MASRAPNYDGWNHENNAPEVVERSSDLIAAPNQTQHEMEYPEAVQHYPAAKGFPTHDAPNYTSASSPQNGQYFNNQEKSGPLLGDAGLEVAAATRNPPRRKRMIWIIAGVGVALVVLAVGLGAGLGVGLSSSSKSSDNSQSQSQSTSTSEPTSTTTATASTTTSSTPSAVTSGTTGVAAFSCGSQQSTSSTSGTSFTQECYTQYTANRASYYYATDNVTTINLGGKYTTYNLTACLDSCDSYNSDGGSPPCRAVTYYANLSYPIQAWGGNCFLKNDRGTDAHADPVDWTHTMSAFMGCLNETCWGEN